MNEVVMQVRIYLDNCCYNRSYDSQVSFIVSLETRAKLHIQKAVKERKYELVGSYMLECENSVNRDEMKRIQIKEFQDNYSACYVPIERRELLHDKIEEIMQYNIAYKDATHYICKVSVIILLQQISDFRSVIKVQRSR